MNQALLFFVLLVLLTPGCSPEKSKRNLESGIEVSFPIPFKKPDYITSKNSAPEKSHNLVKKLAHELISHIEIKDDQVLIICKTDTLKAKAGVIHSYCEGDTVQKLSSRQRIDFMIKKLSEDSVSCKYFYVIEIEDEYYNETGTVILKSKN
jgi:hypothetical protein